MKTNTGFDLLAPVYDSMARFVFGNAIIDSQTFFLKQIQPGFEILILGGGTGWVLEKISGNNNSCSILFIDASSEMIKRAMQRKTRHKTQFILGTEQDIPLEKKFDVIITNFYFDLFSDRNLISILTHIHQHTKPTSTWVVTDFKETTWWHRGMLKVMYLFFRWVSRIEANKLPQWPASLQSLGWREIETKHWYGDFIKSSMWHRQ